MSQRNTALIAKQNDLFRQGDPGVPGRWLFTQGVIREFRHKMLEIRMKIFEFDSFSEGDDPYGEHDFGAFNVDGQKIFWKIDYMERDSEFGSEDPTNLRKTVRVLTVMLAEEY